MKRILSICLIVACFLIPCQVQVKATGEGHKTLLVLGDSIAAHFGVAEEDSYEYKLKTMLSQNGEKWDSINWGVDGFTSGDLVTLLSRNLEDTQKRTELEEADLVCISIGGNNLLQYLRSHGVSESLFLGKTNWSSLIKGFQTDSPALLTDFKSDIGAIIRSIRRVNPDVPILFQTIHNVARDTKGSLAFLGKPHSFSSILDPFFAPMVSAIKDLSQELGYTVADTYTAFSKSPQEHLLRPEKIHPNEAGHTLIAEVLFDAYKSK